MEIVEKMSDEQYATVCEAGVEVVEQISAVLKRFGLSPDQGFNVLIVAAGGMTVASELSSRHLAQGVDSVQHLWQVQVVNGDRQLVFNAPPVEEVPVGHVQAN